MPRFTLAFLLIASALTVSCSGEETIVLGTIDDESVTGESASESRSDGDAQGVGGASGVEAGGGAAPLPEPENLLVNGDFAEGTAGLQTGYSLVEVARINEGELAVTDEPHLLHPKVPADVVDVSGEGFLLMVNGALSADVSIFEQTIEVEQEQSYRFSIWARLWSPGEHIPVLELRLDGLTVNELTEGVTLTEDAWSELTFVWEASASGPLLLSLVNANIEGESNDFFLDSAAVHPLQP